MFYRNTVGTSRAAVVFRRETFQKKKKEKKNDNPRRVAARNPLIARNLSSWQEAATTKRHNYVRNVTRRLHRLNFLAPRALDL